PGASSLTVERAAGASFGTSIVTVDAGQTASLSGLTIANGNDGGVFNNGTLTVSACTITGNSVPLFRDGAGILNCEGTLTVSGSTISGNSAYEGGGISSTGTISSGGTLTISNSTISGNSASFEGGGIAFDGVSLTVSGSTVSGNTAADGGGIFYVGGP